MVQLVTDEHPMLSGPADYDDLVHTYCDCTPFRALCGTVLDDAEELDYCEPEDECVVCYDLAALPCPRCGERDR